VSDRYAIICGRRGTDARCSVSRWATSTPPPAQCQGRAKGNLSSAWSRRPPRHCSPACKDGIGGRYLLTAGGRQDRSQGLLQSEQGLDGCDSHQVLHGIGELPVQRDQSVGLELGQSDVLSVKCVRPAELVGDLPCGILKKIVVVFVQPDRIPRA
jgi:hypothetical protein